MIRILPDHIANRIAAGEVVQRPASAVKELLENAVDSGATKISLIVIDAGRTLIQVQDNGCGMSAQEARIAFERHATSKISVAEDLECIQTFGFRGEALAAIAAVAEVSLKTCQASEELGIEVQMKGSDCIKEEPVVCPAGANFEVRNLFYNVPARRKFLKSDAVEFKHILLEFTRVALCQCNIEFKLLHNGQELYHLQPSKLKQRLALLLGREMEKELVDLDTSSSLVRFFGYIGKPENARKSQGHQFFFINGRYFRSSYFQRAVLNAYEHLIPEKAFPSWCIFIETDPHNTDVNIHPAKTEVKIDNEQILFQILYSAVKEALGRNSLGPSIDFDVEGVPNIPPLKKGLFAPPPKINYNPLFNPFDEERFEQERRFRAQLPMRHSSPVLYEEHPPELFSQAEQTQTPQRQVLQLKGKYLLTPVKSGLLLIHLKRARQRIRYEHYLQLIETCEQERQQTLFPQELLLNPAAVMLLEEFSEELLQLGFDIRPFGKDSVVVYGLPVGYSTENEDVAKMMEALIDQLTERTKELKEEPLHCIALSLALSECRSAVGLLPEKEAGEFIDHLFACTQANISPTGKVCMHIISIEEFDKMLTK